MDCEHELDGCKVKPCSVGQNCTDIPADQQGNSSIGYICGPCPPGFSDFDGKCAGRSCTCYNFMPSYNYKRKTLDSKLQTLLMTEILSLCFVIYHIISFAVIVIIIDSLMKLIIMIII